MRLAVRLAMKDPLKTIHLFERLATILLENEYPSSTLAS